MSWVMGQLAAQNLYQPREDDPWADPMPWASDAASAQQGYDPDAGAEQAERWAAERPYRGQPLDTGLRREPGDSSMLPAAEKFAAFPGTFKRTLDSISDAAPGVVMGAIADIGRVPGDMMAKNPYKPGTEEALFFDTQRTNKAANWAPEMAMNLMGTGTAFAMTKGMKNTAGMLGGKLTATPRQLKALDRAKDMQKEGHSAGEIWRDAKWDQFKDGQWRYEIPGRSGGGIKTDSIGKLKDIWTFPQLYDRYPALGELEASVGKFKASDFPNLHKNTAAFYLPNRGIHIMKDAPKNSPLPKWLLQHEGTHGIQELENFARGDSPLSQSVWDTVKAERATKMQEMQTVISDVQQMRDEWINRYLKNNNKGGGFYDHFEADTAWRMRHPEIADDLMVATEDLNKLFSTDPTDAEKMRAYMRSHGETEANMVPDRAKFMQQSLTERPPSTDMHWVTPYDEQIVNFNNPMPVKKMGGLLGTGR